MNTPDFTPTSEQLRTAYRCYATACLTSLLNDNAQTNLRWTYGAGRTDAIDNITSLASALAVKMLEREDTAVKALIKQHDHLPDRP